MSNPINRPLQKPRINLEDLMDSVLLLARSEDDPEMKLQMIDRILKYEALKLKAQQGKMGSGFDDDGDAA